MMFRSTDEEISDLIARYDPETLIRLPVPKQELVDRLRSRGQHSAAGVVSKIPTDAIGHLDASSVDSVYLKCHAEMQRLAEEFYHGHRVLSLLHKLLRAIRSAGYAETIRIVDIGTGLGYVPRWLALRGDLEGVEILGVDLNAALLKAARKLAVNESLHCRFEHANAFRLEHRAHIYISTGVLHHFRGSELTEFFRGHDAPETLCFAHWDFQPGPLAPLGSWFFHQVRMRTPLARHDGTLSDVRAHSAQTLLDAARPALPNLEIAVRNRRVGPTPLPRVFHTVVGMRPEIYARFEERRAR